MSFFKEGKFTERPTSNTPNAKMDGEEEVWVISQKGVVLLLLFILFDVYF